MSINVLPPGSNGNNNGSGNGNDDNDNDLFVIRDSSPNAVPSGVYQCRFGGVTKQTIADRDNGGEKVVNRWEFEVLNGEHTGTTLDALVDRVQPTTKNKAGKFLAGLVGTPPTNGQTVRISEHVGKTYQLVMSPNNNGKVSINSFSPVTPA